MTATPRLCTDSAKARAALHSVDVLSMDDPATFGPEFHRLPFSRAVEQNLLSDYKTALIVNEFIRLSGIPATAHQYQANGRTPLEWFIDHYGITRDRESGIVHDPNRWFDDPRDLMAAIRRIVHVSVETVRVVEHLPAAFETPDEGDILEALRRSPLVGANIDFTPPYE